MCVTFLDTRNRRLRLIANSRRFCHEWTNYILSPTQEALLVFFFFSTGNLEKNSAHQWKQEERPLLKPFNFSQGVNVKPELITSIIIIIIIIIIKSIIE